MASCEYPKEAAMEYLEAQLPRNNLTATSLNEAFRSLCDCAKLDESGASDSVDMSLADAAGSALVQDERYAMPNRRAAVAFSPRVAQVRMRQALAPASPSPVVRPASIAGSPLMTARQTSAPRPQPRRLFDSASRSQSAACPVRASPMQRDMSPSPFKDLSLRVADLSTMSTSLQASFAGTRQSLGASTPRHVIVRQQSCGSLVPGPLAQKQLETRSSLTARPMTARPCVRALRAPSPARSSSRISTATVTAVVASPSPQVARTRARDASVLGPPAVRREASLGLSQSRRSLTSSMRAVVRPSLSSSLSSVAASRSRSLEIPVVVADARRAPLVAVPQLSGVPQVATTPAPAVAWPSGMSDVPAFEVYEGSEVSAYVPGVASPLFDLGASVATMPLGASAATSAADTDTSLWASQRTVPLQGLSTATTAASVPKVECVKPLAQVAPSTIALRQIATPLRQRPALAVVATPSRCNEDASGRAEKGPEKMLLVATQHYAARTSPAASWPTRRSALKENRENQVPTASALGRVKEESWRPARGELPPPRVLGLVDDLVGV